MIVMESASVILPNLPVNSANAKSVLGMEIAMEMEIVDVMGNVHVKLDIRVPTVHA